MAASKPQTNPNESLPYRILHATKWSKGGRGEKSMRVVMMQYVGGGKFRSPYAVRWQDRDGNTFGGSSFEEKTQAHNAFLRKYLNHNEAYGPNNISHLPGIAK